MQESSKKVTLEILNALKPKTILDTPCGVGWLAERLGYQADIDGIDLYEDARSKYRAIVKHDLDLGLPTHLGEYDAIVCCEGLEHFANPNLFLSNAFQHLKVGGTLLITTPNVWYPGAKIQYFLRGFFPGFPCIVGKIKKGTHMHITPWSFPHLFLYLTLSGFKEIKIHWEPMSEPKRFYEKILALPQKLYCQRKARKAVGEEKLFWENAMSKPSLYGRHLIVTAQKIG